MSQTAVDAELAVTLVGAAFLLLGASFAGFGPLGLSPRLDELE